MNLFCEFFMYLIHFLVRLGTNLDRWVLIELEFSSYMCVCVYSWIELFQELLAYHY